MAYERLKFMQWHWLPQVFLLKLLDRFYRNTVSLGYFSTEKSTGTVDLNERKPMDSRKGEEEAWRIQIGIFLYIFCGLPF